MRCAHCTTGALVEIRMRVGAADVVFRRCGRCESQTWTSEDGPVPLTRVLDLARTA